MNKPEVSIITPAYKCAETILETYESIKNQTFSDWEWIVVEDHSPDNSYEILKKLAFNDNRIVLLQTPQNSGTSIARNTGTDHARGKYIAFLDADDLWKPNKLEVQLEFMKERNVSLCYSNYDVLFPDGTTKLFCPKNTSANYKTLLKRNDLGCLTVAYDAEKIGKIYMPLDAAKREDYAAWLDITKKGVIAFKINESLAIYRLGIVTLTSNKKKMIKYHYRVYRNHEKFGVLKSLYYLLIFSLNKKFTKYN